MDLLKVERLLFRSLPGIPAENRWTAFHPFASFMLVLMGVFEMGFSAWQLAFAAHEELDEEHSEKNLSPEQLAEIHWELNWEGCTHTQIRFVIFPDPNYVRMMAGLPRNLVGNHMFHVLPARSHQVSLKLSRNA